MARSRVRRSPCFNPPPTGNDELAGGAPGALTNGSGIFTPTTATSCTPTPTPAPVPGPTGMYTDVDLQRATKLALELFVKGQEHGQANSSPCERPLKARFLHLYYGNSYMLNEMHLRDGLGHHA